MPKYLYKTGLSRLWGRMKSVLVTPLSNRVTVLEQNTTTSTDLEELTARVDMLQLKYHTEVSSYTYNVTFANLTGLKVTGVWNTASKRIEF